MTQTSIKRRKILFGSIIIVVLVISLIGAVIIYNQLIVTRISLSLSTTQIKILQGSSSQIQVNVKSQGSPETTTLDTNLNSSAIQCCFSPATGKSSFNSTLTINVPDSTPTGNYSLTARASGNTTRSNASCIISVLSKNVEVSGDIRIFSPYTSIIINSLQFKDTKTMTIYTASLTLDKSNLYYDYTVVLKNEETYNITVNFHYGIVSIIPFSASGFIGSQTVYAPAGNSTITGLNLTYNQP
ncbi:MAG TPA: hypothetical protein VK536_01830 [Candidatus Limnocylindrales bacterium]|nr:hypothetical protein [Candidatus Limnocylindrales bacterium]